MGCCLSRDGDPNSPYSGGAASGSARAINEAAQAGGASASQTGNDEPSSASRRRRRHSQQPLAQHINRPLRRHEWTSHDRQWTRAALRRERAEFFDTRVTGRQEIWQTLHAALEILWVADEAARNGLTRRVSEDDGPSEDDPAIALATAQSILDAADITLPTGDLYNGAYDAFGNYYQLPHPIVSDPLNLVWKPGSNEDDDLDDAKTDLTGGEEMAEEREYADEEAERRREEKGKAVVDIRDQITIKARLSDGSRDVNVAVDKADTVRSIARLIAEEAQLHSSKKIRIAYMGKILKEGSPLLAQGWKQGHVVNALVFNR
ncbi:Ubiquitin domain-containing protein 2 [Madurella fahalii]|uniref:Ubiquitin domain-containing protein 2 n=1 Tax=Madurella fahalii TaxID=1157608 RepID=A0ABQ0GN52_9PEZI